MTIWIDAQLSPFIALWINENFPDLNAKSLRSIGLRDASDDDVYEKAKLENVIIMSKDADFVRLIETKGCPPKLIWITCGNTSNAQLCRILERTLIQALSVLKNEDIVEIN